jgi:hypothetical protein
MTFLFNSGGGVFFARQADSLGDFNWQGDCCRLERQTAVLVFGTVTGVISREQNARVLPLLDAVGNNPASCRAKNIPPPHIIRIFHHK